MTGVAFKRDHLSTNAMEKIYRNLSEQAWKNSKFLGFACKILINTELETEVMDGSIIVENRVHKFYVKLDGLINNSVVGYLPNVYDLANATHQTEDLSFKLESSELSECFRLNKFDGVLTFAGSHGENESQVDCYTKEKYPVKLEIRLESHNASNQYAQIWVYDVSLKQSDMSNYQTFYEVNSNAVNIIYASSLYTQNQPLVITKI